MRCAKRFGVSSHSEADLAGSQRLTLDGNPFNVDWNLRYKGMVLISSISLTYHLIDDESIQ